MTFEGRRRQIEEFFVPGNLIGDSRRSVISPSNRFRLDVDRYTTGPKSWNYSRGSVRRAADDVIIADVKRNYGQFWCASITRHPSGNEYLLCGEDYQGYSVVNLDQAVVLNYLPPETPKGWGFCWTAAYPSPDGRTLAVDRCYWACPYELVFYDFTNPSVLPLPELERIGGLERVIGWESNDTFRLACEYEARKSDGVRYAALSEEDQETLDRDSSLMIEIQEEVCWTRQQTSK